MDIKEFQKQAILQIVNGVGEINDEIKAAGALIPSAGTYQSGRKDHYTPVKDVVLNSGNGDLTNLSTIWMSISISQ